MISDLDELFAPLGAAAFFADHYENEPLHIARAGRADLPLLTHDDLLRALSAAATGSAPATPSLDTLLLFPEHAGATRDALLTDPARLRAYLDAGHPLVWNRAHGIAPAVDALTALLTEAFGARVWPNVYAIGTAGPPFDAHFDAHEIIAIQCEGEKRWWLSEVRVDRPLDAPEMEPAVTATLRLRRDEAAARTLRELTTRPGDLVYIPRGQFHNARAAAGRSLHVTFGIRLPSAFEVAQKVVADLLADPLLRETLPPRASDAGGRAQRGLLDDVAARLGAALRADALLAAAADVRARWARPAPRERP